MGVCALITLDRAHLLTPETILRRPTQRVDDFGAEFQRVVDDLVDTMLSHRIAVGLAAPQIDLPLSVAVINISETRDPGNTLVIVNPVVESESGKKDTKRESCMSVPFLGGPVTRREKVALRFQDRLGAPKELRASGFLSRVLAHEIDHLNGLLYIDRMSSVRDLVEVEIFSAD